MICSEIQLLYTEWYTHAIAITLFIFPCIMVIQKRRHASHYSWMSICYNIHEYLNHIYSFSIAIVQVLYLR